MQSDIIADYYIYLSNQNGIVLLIIFSTYYGQDIITLLIIGSAWVVKTILLCWSSFLLQMYYSYFKPLLSSLLCHFYQALFTTEYFETMRPTYSPRYIIAVSNQIKFDIIIWHGFAKHSLLSLLEAAPTRSLCHLFVPH